MIKIDDLKLHAYLEDPYYSHVDLFKWLSSKGIQDEIDPVYATFLLSKQSPKKNESPVYELEEKLIHVLLEMETHGAYINKEKLTDIGKKLQKEIQSLEEKILSKAGYSFNIKSPKQVQKFLFEDMKITPIKKTKTGYSVDNEVLEVLKKDYPVCGDILIHRQYSKLLGTYIEWLIKFIHPETKKIHSHFLQTRTSTGRLASDRPNLQNIPSGDPYSDEIKSCFCPQKKWYFYFVADYSQVEIRILACLSWDRNLLQVFKDGIDIHTQTAKHFFKTDTVTPEQRQIAKTVNFWIIYGITGFGLSKVLPITPKQGTEYIEAFYNAYPDTKTYFEKICSFARENGYVQTFFGRKRYIPKINDRNEFMRKQAEREAINMPIQWTSADLTKMAMVHIYDFLHENSMESKIILQVHDEIILEIPQSEQEKVEKNIPFLMTSIVNWDIPLEVHWNSNTNWLTAK